MIEQYPETTPPSAGVGDEFEKFLANNLTEKQVTSRLVSVAQQVEQRETLAIQYTIELRTMLRDMPVRDEIREFLFGPGPGVACRLCATAPTCRQRWPSSARPQTSSGPARRQAQPQRPGQVIQNLPAAAAPAAGPVPCWG